MKTLSSLFTVLILISILTPKAHTENHRCEDLFAPSLVTETQVQQIAEQLAWFRLNFLTETNRDQLKILNDEFEIKYAEYIALSLANNVKNAPQIFREALVKTQKARIDEKLDQQKTERESQKQLISEQNDLRIWKGFLRLKPFGSVNVASAKFTSDGSRLLVTPKPTTPGALAELKIYDAKNMQELKAIHATNGWSTQVVMSTEGSTLAFISGKTSVTLVDLHTLEERVISLEPENKGLITSITISADGSKLLYASVNKLVSDKILIELYDAKKNKKIPLPQKEFAAISHFVLSPDGKKVILGHKSSVVVLDIKRKKTIPIPDLPEIPDVAKLLLSPDGNFLTIFSWNQTSIRVFNMQTLRTEKFDFPKNVNPPDFVPNTSWLTVPGQGFASILDVKTGKQVNYLLSSLTAQPSAALAALTPDAGYFLIHIQDKSILLDTSFNEVPFSNGNVGTLMSLQASPDGSKWLAFNIKGDMFVWFRSYEEAQKVKNFERLP